ncbi:MAG: efflux RND transporter periplasmic adaptor subunit [Synergistaceae bacterium]|nr:efflux RND transporter periplasmic adaptor subunit [Synergistaceae bacterium]
MKKILFGTLLFGVIAATLWFVFLRSEEVETVRVSRGDLVRTVEEDGVVEVPGDRRMYATQLARVLDVPVEEGDSVLPGTVLVRMKNADLDVRIHETRTLLDQAIRDRQGASALVESTRLLLSDAARVAARRKRLYEAGAISLSEFEEAVLTLERLEKDLERHQSAVDSAAVLESGLKRTVLELQAKGAELVVKSPIKGIILELPPEKDRVLQPGDHVATVAPEARMEVVSDILSDAMGNVAVGQKVRVTAPVLGSQVLEGKVAKIYPQAFEKMSALGVVQRRVKVRIDLPYSPSLKPGFEVRVAIETERHPGVLLLPIESVRTTESGERFAMKIERNRIKSVPIRTGLADRRSVEILEGLHEGDEVVRDAGLDLDEGRRVRVQR